jgi:hypothetical protein
MNNPDHISESLETMFWVKILKFFDADADPGSGFFWPRIRDPGLKKFGSGINIPNPQHCESVLRIRIHMFLGLPDPDPLVRGMDPDPDPSIIMQKYYEKPWFLLFCDSFLLFIFEQWCKCTFKK